MIIAIKGPAQCGKSTLANVLDAEFQYRGFKVRRTAFSDFVREEIAEFLQAAYANHPIGGGEYPQRVKDLMGLMPSWVDTYWDRDCPKDQFAIINDLKKRPAPRHIRAIQQWWGQDFRRAQDSLYWVKKSFAANVEYLLDPAYIVIEESCRQPNEGAYVRALGGVVLDLKPLAPPTESEAAAMSHSVEQVTFTWEGDIDIDMNEFHAMDDQGQMEWTRVLVADLIYNWCRINA
jgi:hypothetical protein